MSGADCRFCSILTARPETRKWFDEPLFEEGGIKVIPGLGAQAPGYLLIVPELHAPSTAELPSGVRLNLEVAKDIVRHVLYQSFGRCVFFEHGTCDGYRAGACIDHVHVHAFPTETQVLRVANEKVPFEPMMHPDDLALWRGRPYVVLEDQGGSVWVADGENRPGQFMRRVIAEALEEPDEWDYEMFPNLEHVQTTVERLSPLFAGLERFDPRHDQRWSRLGPESPLIYVARAVDLRPPSEVREKGESIRARLRGAGFAAVDPVASMFPGRLFAVPDPGSPAEFGRVESDLAWLRRSDALVVDLGIEKWSYVGCICELVYAYDWGIPTIVITGDTDFDSRLWVRYHATKMVHDLDSAIIELKRLFPGPQSRE